MGLLDKVLGEANLATPSDFRIDAAAAYILDETVVRFRCHDGLYRLRGSQCGWSAREQEEYGFHPIYLDHLPMLYKNNLKILQPIIGVDDNKKIIVGKLNYFEGSGIRIDGYFNNMRGENWYLEYDQMRDANGLIG